MMTTTRTKAKRDSKGRFDTGVSENPHSRPVRGAPPIHRRQVRTEFFTAAHEMITIIIDGKRRRMTRIHALFELEMAEALNGKSKTARKRLIDLYSKLSAEHEDTQVAMMEALLQDEARSRF
jgi:hypothetical protein